MAKKSGGSNGDNNGKGSTKIIKPAEEQDAIRRAKKKGPKTRPNGAANNNPHVGEIAERRKQVHFKVTREAALAKQRQKDADRERFRAQRQEAIDRQRQKDAERKQQRQAGTATVVIPQQRKQSIEENFLDRLHGILSKKANELNWSDATRKLVFDYVSSLMVGDASAPENLRGKPLEMVRQKFATTCAFMNVPDGTFPGQSADWFDQSYRSAVAYRDRNKRTLAHAS